MTLYASPKESHEWRLVVVRGRIDTVHKLGDRWRAELVVGGDRVVVVGQSGARIPVGSVVSGRLATVTGIVRRPYPSATDRRFSILPRGRGDLRVDSSGSAGAASKPASGAGSTKPGAVPGRPGTVANGAGSALATAPDANLADLATLAGRTVRVGGLVGDLVPGGFLLDDGTATGPISLDGAAADLLPLIAPGDAINVVGRVESTDRGWTVIVTDPAGVALAGDPIAPDPTGGPDTSPAAASDAGANGDTTSAGLGDLPGLDAGLAGLGTVVLVTVASLAVTVLRRRHLQGRLATRMASRLATFVGGQAGSEGPAAAAPGTGRGGPPSSRTATHDPRTIDSA